MAKTYAIADLHGRYDLLLEVMRIIEEDAGDNPSTFVCTGDFVDRGPQSRQIIEFLMAGRSKPNWKWIILQGNHEDCMVEAIKHKFNMFSWLRWGGGATLLSYGHCDENIFSIFDMNDESLEKFIFKVPNHHLAWLTSLPLYYTDGKRAFSHAGFDPTLFIQNRHTLQYRRVVKYSNYKFKGMHVVHGHCAYDDGPILTENTTNLDTWAVIHGRLPIAVFDDDISGGPIEIKWAIINKS